MANLEFGIIDHVDLQDIPISQTFDERMEQIAEYDRDGIYAFHVTEHHFTPHGIASSPLIFLAAAARRFTVCSEMPKMHEISQAVFPAPVH